MERNVQRINGIKTHLHELTDEELTQGLDYANARLEQAAADADKLGQELARRYNDVLPLGDIAVRSNVIYAAERFMPGLDDDLGL